jgi:very-short-patch-repair endonuclease
MFKCKICETEFDNILSLSIHNRSQHTITHKETYKDFILSGQTKTCECGCGLETKFLSINKGFRKFKLGHSAKINNNWGHNEKAKINSKNTQKEMYSDGRLVVWNKGLTKEDERVKKYIDGMMKHPDRAKKISIANRGKVLSEETKKKLSDSQKKSWTIEKRNRQSETKIEWIKNNRITDSSLERNFIKIMNEMGIDENNYKRQFYIKDIKSFFDFILYNQILIEVDGDFWHSNPEFYSEPKYSTQKKNKEKDKIKNEYCKKNNLPLFRFWENEIKTNRNEVKKHIITILQTYGITI